MYTVYLIIVLVSAIIFGAGCATLPKVTEVTEQVPADQESPYILAARSFLSPKQSKAIIERLKQQVDPTDILERETAVMESPTRALWDDFRKKSKPVTVPYLLTVGNHDVHDKKSEELYKEETNLPGNKLYYSFSVANSLFVFLGFKHSRRGKEDNRSA